jgi:hypothetical protein
MSLPIRKTEPNVKAGLDSGHHPARYLFSYDSLLAGESFVSGLKKVELPGHAGKPLLKSQGSNQFEKRSLS